MDIAVSNKQSRPYCVCARYGFLANGLVDLINTCCSDCAGAAHQSFADAPQRRAQDVARGADKEEGCGMKFATSRPLIGIEKIKWPFLYSWRQSS